ncbi:hypothetical protein [Caenispirillum bisanense]|uniref:hypothetical protein n=1 Tax=Caenispirillum bisanense TaxID=414052 RepID=UPI0031E3E27E
MRAFLMTVAAVVALVVAVAVTQVAVFVVPAGASVATASTARADVAAGAAPDGMVYIVTRGADMRFVDSADAICRRQFSRPDEGCRGLVRSWVMRETRVLAELPYSETLWRVAAGGDRP